MKWIKGIAYMLIGLFVGLMTGLHLVEWMQGDMDYFIPHACNTLHCLHQTEYAADGTPFCSKFPPKEIKMSGSSGLIYKAKRILGGFTCVAGLLFSGMALFFGFRQLMGLKNKQPACLRILIPLSIFFVPVLLRFFLYPLGFFSI